MAVLRRLCAWVAGRALADMIAVCGAVGATVGAVAAWLGTSGIDRLDSGAGVGAALGSGGAILVSLLCRSVAGQQEASTETPENWLFQRFRAFSYGQIRGQWRVLLEGRGRLDADFDGFRRIAPPRFFTGSIGQRSDLAAAVDAAAAPGGGPRLLVVGSPGQGKTVALLDVAQHLIDVHDDRFGVPALFNLGGWRQDDDDLVAWMVRELCGVTGPLPGEDRAVTRWVTLRWIAPILDGLDEITDRDSRLRCVRAINAFIDQSPARAALVVASRPDEYTEITTQGSDRLAVNAAITLGKLGRDLVAARLRDTAEERDAAEATYLADLADVVDETPTHPVVDVLRVPLWLWTASSLDLGGVAQLTAAPTADDAQRILTDAYLARACAALAEAAGLAVGTCRRLLAAMAGFLADPRSPDATTFRFEDLTPARPNPSQRRAGLAALVLVLGLSSAPYSGHLNDAGGGSGNRWFDGMVAGVVLAMIVAFAVGQAVGLSSEGRPSRSRLRWPGMREMVRSLMRWTAYGAVGGWTFGAIFGTFFGLYVVTLTDWSDGGLLEDLRTGAILGLTIGLFLGVVVGVATGLVSGLLASDLVTGDRIDEGLGASTASVVVHVAGFGLAGLLVGLSFALTLRHAAMALDPVVGLVVGSAIGAAIASNGGGWYLVLQRLARREARQQNLIADDPAAFVRAAVDAGILRRTGGGVQFRHRLFASRLAEEAPKLGLADLHQRSEGAAGAPSAGSAGSAAAADQATFGQRAKLGLGLGAAVVVLAVLWRPAEPATQLPSAPPGTLTPTVTYPYQPYTPTSYVRPYPYPSISDLPLPTLATIPAPAPAGPP